MVRSSTKNKLIKTENKKVARKENMDFRQLVVSKVDALIEASYQLTLDEQRIILFCISLIDTTKELAKDNIFNISVKDFNALYNLESKNTFGQLEAAVERLYERNIKTFDHNSRLKMRWVWLAKFSKEEKMVSIGICPKLNQYLTLLKENFSSYDLLKISRFNSASAIRIFEFLVSHKKDGIFIISVNDFKRKLGLEEKHMRFNNLKQWVIMPAIKEIEKKSSFRIQFKTFRVGKFVKQLQFTFKEV